MAVPAAALTFMARTVRPILWPGASNAEMAENVVYFFLNMNLHLLAFAAAVPAMAAWHRMAVADNVASHQLSYRVSDAEWKYLWRAAGLFCIAYLIAIPGATVFGLMHGHLAGVAGHIGLPGGALQILSLPVYVLIIGALLRLGLSLPRTARDQPAGVGEGWPLSRGNTWRLGAAAALAAAPVAAAWWGLAQMAAPGSLGSLVARELVNVVLILLSAYLLAGLLSQAEHALSGRAEDN